MMKGKILGKDMYLQFMSIYKIWCDMLGVMYNFLDNAHILHNRVLQVVHVILLLAANPVMISSKDIIKDSLIVISHAVFCISSCWSFIKSNKVC